MTRKDPTWMTRKIQTVLKRKSRIYEKYNKCGKADNNVQLLNECSEITYIIIKSSKENHYVHFGQRINDPLLDRKRIDNFLISF